MGKKTKNIKKSKVCTTTTDSTVDSTAEQATPPPMLAEKWDIVASPIVSGTICRIDDCQEEAVETWASNLAPNDEWPMCASCREQEFGSEEEETEAVATTSLPPPPSTENNIPSTNTSVSADLVTESSSTNEDALPITDTDIMVCTKHVDSSMISNKEPSPTSCDSSISTIPASENCSQDSETSTASNNIVEDTPSVIQSVTQDSASEDAFAAQPHDVSTQITTEEPITSPVQSPTTENSDQDASMDVDASPSQEDEPPPEAEEGWDMKKVMTIDDLSKKSCQPCGTDQCNLPAAVVYVSTLSKEEWFCCLDCQDGDFGGWPETLQEIPIQTMTHEHQQVMVSKCSQQASPTFPDFLIELSEKNSSSSDATQGTTVDADHVTNQEEALEEQEQENEAEEGWDLKKIMSVADLSKECTIKCGTDECLHAAAVVYVSTISKQKWYSCLDCQEADYGGWPEKLEELPISTMSGEHKDILASKCSRHSSPIFPALPNPDSLKTPGGKNTSNTTTPRPNVAQQVTPTPGGQPAKGSKSKAPSAAALAMHAKWRAAAEALGGPDARIVVDKKDAKKIIFDMLHDAFEPMNITQIYNALKAIVPSPVLKICLDDMTAKDDGELFADSDDEDEKPKKSKKAKTGGDEFADALCFKPGRNANTSLYYVDHSKMKNNGNGLEPEARNELYTAKAKADEEESILKRDIAQMEADAKQLNSEPTNEEANAQLETQEATAATLREQVEAARKLQVNEKHRKQTKRRIETMSAQWRKRRRLCMDFLIVMEENTDGTVSLKKCLKGDGQMDIESDESAIKAATAYVRNKHMRKKSTKSVGDANFVGVTLDSKGTVERVYIDEGKAD